VVTHPFHPLHGRTLDVVDRRRYYTDEYVYLEADERVYRLPIGWTSLGSVEAFLVVAQGRCLFRIDDLNRLGEIILQLCERGASEDV
jgi:hypothetical protein